MSVSAPEVAPPVEPVELAPAAYPARPRARLWRLREEIPDRARIGLTILSFVGPFLTWFALSATRAVKPLFLPSPLRVIHAFGDLWTSGELLGDLQITVTRIAIGFALVVVISVPLGLAIGAFPAARALFVPIMSFLRYMPAPAFIPLLIIWLGLGESSKIALLLIGTVFFNTFMSADVAALVPKELIDASYTLGASRAVVLRKVILPYTLPGLIDSMRINIAATWQLVIVAELIAAQSGLGYRITRAARFLQTPKIFAVLIVIGLIGVAMDVSFRLLRNWVSPWAR
jgi:NitT/TauT family transport system permease protein